MLRYSMATNRPSNVPEPSAIELASVSEPGEGSPLLKKEHGIPSKIHSYCVDPARKDKRCLWLCQRKGRQFVTWDVPFDPEKSAISLRSQNRWWRRFSFYNYVGVRHVEVSTCSVCFPSLV